MISWEKIHEPAIREIFYRKSGKYFLLLVWFGQVEGPLGKPPYEKPSIAKGVTNFVLHKFTHLPPKVGRLI